MAVKIRLARRGRRKRPYYHIIVADGRSPRDGKFIENIGSYNPMSSPATIELDVDKALDWINKGAQPTETARAILRFKGVLYKKHLMRGVAKGAFSEEKAEEMWNAWSSDKEAKIEARKAQTAQEKKDRWAAISGKPGKIAVAAAVEAGAADAFTEAATEPPATEATEAPAEAVVEAAKEETPAAEAVVEAVKEEAPAAAEVVEEVKEVVSEETPAAAKADDAKGSEEE